MLMCEQTAMITYIICYTKEKSYLKNKIDNTVNQIIPGEQFKMTAIMYWIFLISYSSISSQFVWHPDACKETSAKPLSIYNIKEDNVKYNTSNVNKIKNKTKQESSFNLVPQCQTVN